MAAPMLPAGLAIRPLSPDDSIAELTGLLHRAYAELAEMGLRYLATHQDEDTTRRAIAGGECFVGLLEGRLVATITFSDAPSTGGTEWYDRPEVARFGQFGVDPTLRAQGIGGTLLGLVERRAAETGARELACDTAEPAEHLIRWYAKRGYRIVGRADWRPVTNYGSVILSKPVGPISVPRTAAGVSR